MKTITYAYKPGPKGAKVRPACLSPHMVTMREGLLATAPPTTDGIMWITEAWRPPRHPDDAHAWCNALDIRTWNIIHGEREDLIAIVEEWSHLAREWLAPFSPYYQFEAHGKGSAYHLHAEFDPRGG